MCQFLAIMMDYSFFLKQNLSNKTIDEIYRQMHHQTNNTTGLDTIVEQYLFLPLGFCEYVITCFKHGGMLQENFESRENVKANEGGGGETECPFVQPDD